MSASRWSPPTITLRCTALICCENRNIASRARTSSMKPYDVALAVMVAVIWGLAFVASRIALDEFSPELMTTLRFAIAAVPCLFVRKPQISWPLLIAISFKLFLGQVLAQAYGIAPGLPVRPTRA